MTRARILGNVVSAGAVLLLSTQLSDASQATQPPRSGRQVYETICVACHGPDGRGGVNLELEKTVKPPDFSDCAFTSREPDRGFLAVAHGGGPARGFSPLMPPWGAAFTEAELGSAIGHLRTFCKDDRWPRGELNLPRPMATAKAFPEDEAVMSMASQSGSVTTKFIYERRFGPLNQWEVIVPVASLDAAAGRANGIGDIALEYKRTLVHSLAGGHIFSVTGEVVLPTGNDTKGLGKGTAVFEPFITFGKVLPRDAFIQGQAGFAFPASSGHDNEAFWRVAVGRSFEQGRFGRLWSPMVEVLAARPLVAGAGIEWDVLPGMQVTLNTRQHVRLAGGLRLPVTDTDHRKKSVMCYLLWDWDQGGFGQGW